MTPVLLDHQQPCGSCGIPVHFKLTRVPLQPSEDGKLPPDFVTPVFPDSCWIGWVWSTTDPAKLELVTVCGQQCLLEWFEQRSSPVFPLTCEVPS